MFIIHGVLKQDGLFLSRRPLTILTFRKTILFRYHQGQSIFRLALCNDCFCAFCVTSIGEKNNSKNYSKLFFKFKSKGDFWTAWWQQTYQVKFIDLGNYLFVVHGYICFVEHAYQDKKKNNTYTQKSTVFPQGVHKITLGVFLRPVRHVSDHEQRIVVKPVNAQSTKTLLQMSL